MKNFFWRWVGVYVVVVVAVFSLLFSVVANATEKSIYLEKEVVVRGGERLHNFLLVEYEATPFSAFIKIATNTENVPCQKIQNEIEKNLILKQGFAHSKKKKKSKEDNDLFFDINIKTDVDCNYCYSIAIITKSNIKVEKKYFWGEVFENIFICETNKYIEKKIKEKKDIWKKDNHESIVKKIIDEIKKEFLYQKAKSIF